MWQFKWNGVIIGFITCWLTEVIWCKHVAMTMDVALRSYSVGFAHFQPCSVQYGHSNISLFLLDQLVREGHIHHTPKSDFNTSVVNVQHLTPNSSCGFSISFSCDMLIWISLHQRLKQIPNRWFVSTINQQKYLKMFELGYKKHSSYPC